MSKRFQGEGLELIQSTKVPAALAGVVHWRDLMFCAAQLIQRRREGRSRGMTLG